MLNSHIRRPPCRHHHLPLGTSTLKDRGDIGPRWVRFSRQHNSTHSAIGNLSLVAEVHPDGATSHCAVAVDGHELVEAEGLMSDSGDVGVPKPVRRHCMSAERTDSRIERNRVTVAMLRGDGLREWPCDGAIDGGTVVPKAARVSRSSYDGVRIGTGDRGSSVRRSLLGSISTSAVHF